MSISLVSVRNPKWKTKTLPRWDENGAVLNSDGEYIIDVVNDANGDPVKVIECEAIWTTSEANVHLPVNWLPFVADATSSVQHNKDLYAALVNGDHGAIADE
jgi:hypothetical protein